MIRLIALSILAPLTIFAAPKLPSSLTFGDKASEDAAQLEADTAVVAPGAHGKQARYIATEGELRFTLAIDQDATNYVTLKMWGGDYKGQTIDTDDGSIKLGSPRVDLYIDGEAIDSHTLDYEYLKPEAILPGRHFYRTIRLPNEATHGKESIELTLQPKREIGGAYFKVGGPAPTPVERGVYSRGYYSAVSHTGDFVPESTDPKPAATGEDLPPLPDFDKFAARIDESIDMAVGEIMDRQLYGPEFEKAAKEHEIPAKLYGLFHRYGLPAYLELGLSEGDWETPTTGSGSGRSHSNAASLFMHAYTQPASKYYKDPELLDRSIAMMDAYRRYQGGKGSLEIGGGSNGWIGGPDRKAVRGGLQGFFMGNLARSFMAIWPVIKDDAAIVNQPIDSDGDGELDVTRVEAWAEMFRSYLTHQSQLPGGVANQSRANASGAYLALKALQILHPEESPGSENLNPLLELSSGIAPHPKGGGIWMMTRKGLSLEGQGFCPAYGQHTNNQYPDLHAASGDDRVLDLFLSSLDLFQFMVFPRDGVNGGPLLVSGPQGSRHFPFPGKEFEWMPLIKTAVDYKNDFALWSVDYMLRYSGDMEEPLLNPEMGVHLSSYAMGAIGMRNRLPQLQQLLKAREFADYRLPIERDTVQIKTDEQTGLVAIHNAGEESFFFQENRGGRFHFIAPDHHAFGHIETETVDGVLKIQYGRWLVLQNRTATPMVGEDKGRTVTAAPIEGLGKRKDLVTGKKISLDKPIEIAPYTTLVFDLENK